MLFVEYLSKQFSAAEFLEYVKLENVLNALLNCWVSIYAGQPDVLFMVNRSVFTSNEGKHFSDKNVVALKL